MVVDTSPEELQRTCGSLNRLGITNIVCVDSYQKAVRSLHENKDIDIVIADFAIEPGKVLGLLLCEAAKEEHPGLLFILISKDYSCSVVLDSFRTGAEDILDKRIDTEVDKPSQAKEYFKGPSK